MKLNKDIAMTTNLSITMASISLQNSSPCLIYRCISSYPFPPCQRCEREKGGTLDKATNVLDLPSITHAHMKSYIMCSSTNVVHEAETSQLVTSSSLFANSPKMNLESDSSYCLSLQLQHTLSLSLTTHPAKYLSSAQFSSTP